MIGPRSRRHAADPDVAAARWSARRRLGFTTPKEDEAFDRWLEEPENRLAWEATDGVVDLAGGFAAMPELRDMRERALAARAPRLSYRWRWAGGGAIAATVAGFLALTSVQMIAPTTPPVAAIGKDVQRYATTVGERRNIKLVDGSLIALNTSSVMEVAYGPDRRDIRLLSGQAMFTVAKDKHRPFVVVAGGKQIRATGTKFDVRLDETGGVTVLLVEGRVDVDPVKPAGLARLIPSLATEELAPGEQLSSAAAVPVRMAAEDVASETSWVRGQVVFRDEKLSDAVAEMNRYSTSRLAIEDMTIADLRVSGTFAAGKTDNFVAAVTMFFPIDARRDAAGVTVLEKRNPAK